MTYEILARHAKAARRHSHSPFSRFRVGAAVLTQSGRVYTGCNIENSSFGLTICAERTAIFKAISEGQKKFKAIAVASDGPSYIALCGACRQVLLDLAGNIDIVMCNQDGGFRVLKLEDLLPLPFTSKHFRKSP